MRMQNSGEFRQIKLSRMKDFQNLCEDKLSRVQQTTKPTRRTPLVDLLWGTIPASEFGSTRLNRGGPNPLVHRHPSVISTPDKHIHIYIYIYIYLYTYIHAYLYTYINIYFYTYCISCNKRPPSNKPPPPLISAHLNLKKYIISAPL